MGEVVAQADFCSCMYGMAVVDLNKLSGKTQKVSQAKIAAAKLMERESKAMGTNAMHVESRE